MSRGDAAARLAAKLHEARMRRLGELPPMNRSARIALLRDEIELHPERERELLAHIEELETSMTDTGTFIPGPGTIETTEVTTDYNTSPATHDTDMAMALNLLHMRMAGYSMEPLLDDLRKAYAVVRELRTGPASAAADAEAVRGDPAVPVGNSVRHDAVTCLECGAELKTLKQHLRMAQRSDLAKAAGLGRKS